MRNNYTFSETFTTAISLLLTKLFYKKARLVRYPVYIRGKKHMIFGRGLTLGHNCRFDLSGNGKTLSIGENCEFGDNTHIVAHNNVEIGNNVLMASKVFISDTDHGRYGGDEQSSPFIKPNDRPLYSDSVIIGDNVWIGENAVILSGVRIESGCVIGANSVVTRNISKNCIAVGAPARVIKRWDDAENRWIRV